MPTPVVILDSKTGKTATLGLDNALSVVPPKPSVAYNATLETDDTAVEIVAGKSGQRFYITGLVLVGNKNISNVTDATVTIYSATADSLVTVISNLLVVPVATSSSLVINPIMLEVPEGQFIMGKTSDDDVYVTLFGFYLDI